MRPTNRMLISPSPRIFSSAGRCGAAGDAFGVDGDGHHAGRREPELLEFLPVELRVAERQIDVADERSQLLTSERRKPEEPGVVRGEERRRRDVVILQHPRAVERRERLRHRRGQREVKDRDVARARLRIANGRTSPRRSSSIVSAKRSEMCPAARSMSRTRSRAVADRVPAVGGGDPLVDDHDGGMRDCGSWLWRSRTGGFGVRVSPSDADVASRPRRGLTGSALYSAGRNCRSSSSRSN